MVAGAVSWEESLVIWSMGGLQRMMVAEGMGICGVGRDHSCRNGHRYRPNIGHDQVAGKYT